MSDIFAKKNENANNTPKNFNAIPRESDVNISNGTLEDLKSVSPRCTRQIA